MDTPAPAARGLSDTALVAVAVSPAPLDVTMDTEALVGALCSLGPLSDPLKSNWPAFVSSKKLIKTNSETAWTIIFEMLEDAKGSPLTVVEKSIIVDAAADSASKMASAQASAQARGHAIAAAQATLGMRDAATPAATEGASAAAGGNKRPPIASKPRSRETRARGPASAGSADFTIFDGRAAAVLEPKVALGSVVDDAACSSYQVVNKLVPGQTAQVSKLDTDKEIATFVVPGVASHAAFTRVEEGKRVLCFDPSVARADGGAELALARSLRSLLSFGENFAPPSLSRKILRLKELSFPPTSTYRLELEPSSPRSSSASTPADPATAAGALADPAAAAGAQTATGCAVAQDHEGRAVLRDQCGRKRAAAG